MAKTLESLRRGLELKSVSYLKNLLLSALLWNSVMIAAESIPFLSVELLITVFSLTISSSNVVLMNSPLQPLSTNPSLLWKTMEMLIPTLTKIIIIIIIITI